MPAGREAGLVAGVGRVRLPAPLGWPMMGYGARRGTANALHDPLFARALFFANGDGRALLVEADLCLVGVAQARAVRDRIAAATGLSREEILFGCIHTHSGPETGLAQVLAGRAEPAEVVALFDAVVRAGVDACEGAHPARVGVGTVPVRPGRNRRVADGPVDPDALVLRVDRVRASGGTPVAVLYIHGCHPTVLGHDNLAYSADWPGAASQRVEEALPGAMAMFALGAHADVDPRTRGLLDLAIPDQSVGESFDVLQRLGREVGDAIAQTARALPARRDVPIAAGARALRLTTHGGDDLDDAGRPRHLAALRADALAALDLPPDSEATTNDLYRIGAERTAGLPPEEARARLARVRVYLRDRTARHIATGVHADVEVQVLRIGSVWLLGLPLEVTVDVDRAWRARAMDAAGETDPRTEVHARVVSIANGWLRYLPHPDHFAAPRATEQYEILQSTFVEGAAEDLLRTGLALRERLAG